MGANVVIWLLFVLLVQSATAYSKVDQIENLLDSIDHLDQAMVRHERAIDHTKPNRDYDKIKKTKTVENLEQVQQFMDANGYKKLQ